MGKTRTCKGRISRIAIGLNVQLILITGGSRNSSTKALKRKRRNLKHRADVNTQG
jgi:hypothetical protein